MKIVFASNNSGKILELQSLLSSFNIQIIPQASLNVSEIEETGTTFVENAILKARHAAEQTGLPAIADDSGLEVAALSGAPGVYSARFAGINANSENNIKKLLHEMSSYPEHRQARFYCVLVFFAHAKDATPLICEGEWPGLILSEPRGDLGFGYDPIFYDPIENASAAQLPIDKKNQISHRGKALKKLIEKLPQKALFNV